MLGYIKTGFKRSSLLTRQLTLFIALIMLCTVLLGVGNALSLSSLMLGETKKSHADILNQAKNEIDQRYYDIREIAIQISLHSDVRKAMYYNQNLSGQRVEVYKRIIDYLSSLEVSYSYVNDIWIYFKRARTIVNTSGKCDMDMFLSVIKDYQNTRPYLDYIGNGVVFTTLCAQKESGKSIVSFAQAVPFNDPNSEYVVFIDVTQSLFSSMIALEAYDNPTYMLLNKDEAIIYGNRLSKELDEYIAANYAQLKSRPSGESTVKLGGESYTLINKKSVSTGYSYLAAIPGSYVRDKIAPMLQTSYLLMLLTLIVGIGFSYSITRALYTPIRGIIDYINISGTPIQERDEIAFIDRFIQMVYEQNRVLKQNIDANRRLIRDRLLKDILAGKTKDDSSLPDSINTYLHMPNSGFIALALCPAPRIETHTPAQVCEALRACGDFPELIRYFIPEKEPVIACAVNIDVNTQRPELVYDLAAGIMSLFRDKFGVGCTVGIGHLYDNILMLSRSFSEAAYALKYKNIKGENTVIHIDEVNMQSAPAFVYTLEDENRLMNCIKTGDPEAAEKILDEIAASCAGQETAPEETDNIFIVLASTVIRVAYDTSSSGCVQDIYRCVQECANVAEKQRCLQAYIRRLSRCISEKRVGQNEQIYSAMVDYIGENYASDISLNILRDKIGFSGSYLSYIFKQVSGENFVDYINKYRIEKAKALLGKTMQSIVSISESCGFNTPNNFIRVFKKYEGITPGQYRARDK